MTKDQLTETRGFSTSMYMSKQTAEQLKKLCSYYKEPSMSRVTAYVIECVYNSLKKQGKF